MRCLTFVMSVMLAACSGALDSREEPTPVHVRVERLDGATIRRITADRVVVMEFWATWCKACRDLLPALERLAELYASEGVVVVGVHVGGDVPEVRRFAQQAGIPYAIMVDEDFAFSRSLDAVQVPTVVLFDTHGEELARAEGLDRSLVDRLERLLQSHRSVGFEGAAD